MEQLMETRLRCLQPDLNDIPPHLKVREQWILLKEELKGGKKIILVTNARHMERSVMLHRKVGFEVIPAPSDYIAPRTPAHIDSIIPSAPNLWLSSAALYEHMSKLWYMLKGVFVPIKEQKEKTER